MQIVKQVKEEMVYSELLFKNTVSTLGLVGEMAKIWRANMFLGAGEQYL